MSDNLSTVGDIARFSSVYLSSLSAVVTTGGAVVVETALLGGEGVSSIASSSTLQRSFLMIISPSDRVGV